MPIFEFKCESCGKIFEKILFSTAQEQNLSCPACGKQNVHRQVSAFGIGGGDQQVSADRPGCSSAAST